ncbi:MAG: aldo/keto reductase [Oscillospiraceae bacterium]|nr:aldo/keto reductase [Oscillospiraceae bacterium]
MEYRYLGKTGLRVSRLCFGSLTMGPLQAGFSPEEAGEILAFAFEQGINFVDMAQLYDVYPYVRYALKKTARDDIVLCSKTYAYEYDKAVEAVEEARKALDRDVIDIFMLHEQESELTLRGHRPALDALYDLKAKGILRAVGISTHHVAAVRAAARIGLDVIHPLINVAGWGIVDGTREEMENAISDAYAQGIGVYIMKAFGGGNLHKQSEKCLEYVLSLPFADAVAIGMQAKDEVEANIHFFETGSYTPEQAQRLREKNRRIHVEDWCVGCGTCAKHCPQGAISVQDGRMHVDQKKCVLCAYCSAFCEMYAIKML